MDGPSDSPVANIVQRLLKRMDPIEYGLMQRSQDDVSSLRDTVERLQRVHEATRPPLPASHRGERALPSPSLPRPTVTADMAENAPLWQEEAV